MNTLPVMLKLEGRNAVIVGGGKVGLRKARALVRAGAKVKIIDPQMHAPDAPDGAEVLHRPYDPGDLKGAAIVFACTQDDDTNARVASDARAAGVPVNVADSPDQCDFYMPAVITDGPVVVAVGTGGAAPPLASMLRDKIKQDLGDDAGRFAETLCEIRRRLQHRAPPQTRMRIIKALCSRETYDLFAMSGPEAVKKRARDLLKQENAE